VAHPVRMLGGPPNISAAPLNRPTGAFGPPMQYLTTQEGGGVSTTTVIGSQYTTRNFYQYWPFRRTRGPRAIHQGMYMYTDMAKDFLMS
jgi:hypothetical protein